MPDNLQKQAMDEEKKQREHLLALNQVIARQVMEKSRMVAGKNSKQFARSFVVVGSGSCIIP